MPLSARAVRAPQWMRRHCVGQLLLAGMPGGPLSAEPDPDTGPVPTPRPTPRPERKPLPRRRDQAPNRPPRGPGGPSGPPTKPARAGRRKPRPARPDLELPRHWTVDFEVLDGPNAGKVKLSSPQARGWQKVIRPFPDAVKEAITEARLYVAEQGHAAWRGHRTELDVLTAHDDPDAPAPPRIPDLAEVKARGEKRWQRTYSKDSLVRPDQDDLTQWTLLPPKPDGSPGGWQSKGGRCWAVPPKGVIPKRRAAGLPTTWEEMQGATAATG